MQVFFISYAIEYNSNINRNSNYECLINLDCFRLLLCEFNYSSACEIGNSSGTITCYAFCLQTIQSGQSTKFLKTILTTTPSTSHISNFRNQPRSDSRADKPDTFSGFDLQDDINTTPSAVLKRRQAYSHLLRMFIQKTRERLETIREVARHERALAHAKKLAAMNGINNGDAGINTISAEDTSTETIEITLGNGDEDDDDDEEVKAYLNQLEMATEATSDVNNESVPRRYFTTLLSTAGLQRVVDQQRQTEAPTQPVGFITAYVYHPLLNLWQTARNNFNLNYLNIVNRSAIEDETNNSPVITEPDASNAADNNENNGEEIAFNSPDKSLNGSSSVVNARNANPSSPFKLNVNSAPHSMKEVTKEKSHFERAALVFQNAFYKYAAGGGGDGDDGSGSDSSGVASASNSTDVSDDDGDDGSADNVDIVAHDVETNENGLTERITKVAADMGAAKSLSFIDLRRGEVDFGTPNNTTYLNGYVNNDSTTTTSTDSPNIQIIPSHENLALKLSNGSMIAVPNAAESAGIYVLEVVGSVVGLTWGAVSQIQNWFNKG